MPKAAEHALVWLPQQQMYEWQSTPRQKVQGFSVESASWQESVKQISSFAFHGKNGSFTVCKEYKQRGKGYWYGYVRVKGKLTKRYIGSDSHVSFAQLEKVAYELWMEGPASKHGQEYRREQAKKKHMHGALKADPLLATKLAVPLVRTQIVHRPRLIQRLQHGLQRALTLISAPVGFGKSTLLSDWLVSAQIPVAWLSLEESDNEPGRFISYLLAAVHTALPQVERAKREQPSSLEGILTQLINDLLEQGDVQEQLVLVLDNYQVIVDEEIHWAVSFLIAHLPAWIHLMLLTREDPPLPLAQLRGRDELLELRAANLRFTQEEAEAFLIKVMKLPVSQEESMLLQARTEGWITGLQLAAFSLQGREEVQSFIMAFSGSHHYVVDYLLEEVLQRQSTEVQDFLLQTCGLDRLSAPLCDAVRERDNSQELLDYLERANLFLVALDDAGEWYRYHRLFAEALRQQLQRVAPALVPVLQERGQRWYRQRGFSIEESADEQQTVPIDPLTVREREVLQLLLKGASNKEIAEELVLSMNTVKKHVQNICRKFEVRSRTQVIAKVRTFHLP